MRSNLSAMDTTVIFIGVLTGTIAQEAVLEDYELPNADATCRRAYYQRIQTLCRYPDQSWPCFHGSRLIGDTIQHIFDVSGIAAQACNTSVTDASGVNFSLGDVYKDVCCFTPDCLEKCYGVIPDLDNDLFMRSNNLPRHAVDAGEGDATRLYERKRSGVVVMPPPPIVRISLLESLGVGRVANGPPPAIWPVQVENVATAAALRAKLEAELFVRLLQAVRNSQLLRRQSQVTRLGIK